MANSLASALEIDVATSCTCCLHERFCHDVLSAVVGICEGIAPIAALKVDICTCLEEFANDANMASFRRRH